MRPRHRLRTTLGIGFCAGILGGLSGCGFGDLFRPAGPRDVRLQYAGDSILAVGDSLPFVVTVSANGVPLQNPHLVVGTSDSTVLVLTPARDSLIALRTGTATLTAQLIDPAFTDSLPTLAVRFRVHGGGP